MKKNCVPILAGIAVALVLLSGSFISLSFSQVMGSSRSPSPPPQFIPVFSRAICNSDQRFNKPDMYTDTIVN